MPMAGPCPVSWKLLEADSAATKKFSRLVCTGCNITDSSSRSTGSTGHVLIRGNTPAAGVKHQAVSWGGLNEYIYGALGSQIWGNAYFSSKGTTCREGCSSQGLTKFKAWTSPPALTWPNGTLRLRRAFSTRRLEEFYGIGVSDCPALHARMPRLWEPSKRVVLADVLVSVSFRHGWEHVAYPSAREL